MGTTSNLHNLSVGLTYQRDNQLTIFFDGIYRYLDSRTWKHKEKEFVGGGLSNIYQISLHSFYHNLAKECNKYFGTNFAYSQEFIDKVKFLKQTRYNIGYEYDWTLHNVEVGGDVAEIYHNYWYEGYSKSFIGLGGICSTTYGNYDKDSIISMVKVVGKAIFEDGIDKVVYEELSSKYADYDVLGVKYEKEWGYDSGLDIEKLVINL